MNRQFVSTVVGVSVAFLSFIGAPAYAGDKGHGGGGHAGSSGSAHGGSAARGYSGTGISRGAGSYGGRYYSSGISTGHYGGYGQRVLRTAKLNWRPDLWFQREIAR